MFNTALKQRIFTALLLIPLTLLAIYQLPNWGFAFLTGILVVLAAWEWTKLCAFNKTLSRSIYLLIIVTSLIVSTFTFFNFQLLFNLYCLAAVWWLIAALWIYKFQSQQQHLISKTSLYPLIGFIVLLPCWLGLNNLRMEYGANWVLLLLLVVWATDIGAFFVGRRWGKHRLAINVSPGKTWEGFLGGLVCASVIAIIASLLLHFPLQKMLLLWSVIMLTAIFSVVGDLFISVLKRQQGLKDTGALLPGHGGLLDRIDSLLAATPIFILGLHIL